jgi:Uma2 family endonuclease
MSVVSQQAEQRVLLSGISWATFESLLADTRNHGTRFTYDRGYLEMMSPSREHERMKRLIGRMVEAMTEELAIPMSSAGSTTLKAEWKERGLEADESYYIANEPRVRGRDEIDLRVDPPPDLAIEVDVTNTSLPRMPVFAQVGVPEVWRLDERRRLHFYRLKKAKYQLVEQSVAFAFLKPADVMRFVNRRAEIGENAVVRAFVEWATKAQAKARKG